MKKIEKIIVSVSSLILFYSCDCSDEEFSIARKPYLGNEIKTNGYFYSYDATNNNGTSIKFFYRNGVVLSGGRYSSQDLTVIESEISSHILTIKNEKNAWSPFEVKNNTLIIETYWDNPPSCKLRTQRMSYEIQNDTTIIWRKTDHPGYKDKIHNTVWYFKEYYSKPDSTNVYIK